MMNGARAQLVCVSPPPVLCPRLDPFDHLLFTPGRTQKPKCQMIWRSRAARSGGGGRVTGPRGWRDLYLQLAGAPRPLPLTEP